MRDERHGVVVMEVVIDQRLRLVRGIDGRGLEEGDEMRSVAKGEAA